LSHCVRRKRKGEEFKKLPFFLKKKAKERKGKETVKKRRKIPCINQAPQVHRCNRGRWWAMYWKFSKLQVKTLSKRYFSSCVLIAM